MIDLYNNKLSKIIFVIISVLCPLVFFTNLTRNPYYFQITILNISLSVIGMYISVKCLKKDKISIRLGSELIVFMILIFVFFISSLNSYFSHSSFYKPSIISEFKRIWLFTLINAFLPFFISSNIPDDKCDFEINSSFIILWGVLWFLFPYFKSSNIFFDFYGFVLWTILIVYLCFKIKKINQDVIINLFILAGFYASWYGIFQYFGFEFIWPKVLNPYGRRAVSSFGNPNFVSSYVLMMVPFVIYYFIRAKTLNMKIFYFLAIISYIGMIFASLTRSTLLGLIFVVLFLLSFKEYRSFLQINSKKIKKVLLVFVLILFLWPDQNLKPLSFGVINRIYDGLKNTVNKISLNIEQKDLYPSFHQRLLIWSSGLMMFKENPIIGKGWGSFELFYPFYQARIMREYPVMLSLRTHANNAHNEIIEIISQTGIIGFGISVLFILSIIYSSIKYIEQPDNDDKIVVLTALGSILAMLVDNMLNVSIHFAVPGLLFFWICGFVSSKSNGKVININIRWKIKTITIFIVLFLTLVITIWIRQFFREYYYFKGFKETRNGNYTIAKTFLERAYNYHKREVNNDYELANVYVKLEDYNKASYMYKEALKSNAGYDEIYFNLGIIEKKIDNNIDALNYIKTSLWINPLNEKAYYAALEIMLRDIRKYRYDIEYIINDGLKIHKNDSYIHSVYGYLYETDGEYKKAGEEYLVAVMNDPYNEIYLNNFNRVYRENNKEKVLKFITIYRNLFLKNIFDKNEIKNIIDKSEDLKKFLKFKFLMARYYYEIENYNISLDILDDILNNDNKFYPALYAKGLVLEKMDRIEDAIVVYEEYLTYKPEDKNVANHLNELKVKNIKTKI